MASGSSGYDSKVWEHIDYYYDIKAWMPRNFVFANKDAFLGLSDESRACVLQSAGTAEAYGNERAVEMTTWYVEQLIAEGMNVIPPGAKLKAELTDIGQTLSSEWAERTGKKGEAILSEFYRLAESQ